MASPATRAGTTLLPLQSFTSFSQAVTQVSFTLNELRVALEEVIRNFTSDRNILSGLGHRGISLWSGTRELFEIILFRDARFLRIFELLLGSVVALLTRLHRIQFSCSDHLCIASATLCFARDIKV